MNRKIIYTMLAFFFILVIILAAIIFSVRKNDLQVVFLDVGQGDAILISQGSNQVLIDGGKDGKLLLQKIGKFVPFWDRNIETIVETHPDSDHIGGFIDLLKTYNVKTVVKTNAKSESETFKKLEEETLASGAEKIEAKKALKIIFPNDTVAEILHPFYSLPEAVDGASNDNSVVIKMSYGKNNFLFTGDLPSTNETKLINSEADLNAQILKISHHGSKYSTGDEFLNMVKPKDAVISVGKNNSYGHPSQEVLTRLLQHRIKILRTDEAGDIEYLCENGENFCTVVN